MGLPLWWVCRGHVMGIQWVLPLDDESHLTSCQPNSVQKRLFSALTLPPLPSPPPQIPPPALGTNLPCTAQFPFFYFSFLFALPKFSTSTKVIFLGLSSTITGRILSALK